MIKGRLLIFIALVIIAIGSVLYLIGNNVSKAFSKDVSENLENDIQKGEQAKQTIKQLNKKIK
jgi:Flp pilus assembly pilin Flp